MEVLKVVDVTSCVRWWERNNEGNRQILKQFNVIAYLTCSMMITNLFGNLEPIPLFDFSATVTTTNCNVSTVEVPHIFSTSVSVNSFRVNRNAHVYTIFVLISLKNGILSTVKWSLNWVIVIGNLSDHRSYGLVWLLLDELVNDGTTTHDGSYGRNQYDPWLDVIPSFL